MFFADILNANPSTASLCPLPRCRCRHPQRRRVSHAAVRANLSPRLAQWTALRQRIRRACAWMLRYKASACQGAPPDTRHPSTPSLTEFFSNLSSEFWVTCYSFTIYNLHFNLPYLTVLCLSFTNALHSYLILPHKTKNPPTAAQVEHAPKANCNAAKKSIFHAGKETFKTRPSTIKNPYPTHLPVIAWTCVYMLLKL